MECNIEEVIYWRWANTKTEVGTLNSTHRKTKQRKLPTMTDLGRIDQALNLRKTSPSQISCEGSINTDYIHTTTNTLIINISQMVLRLCSTTESIQELTQQKLTIK